MEFMDVLRKRKSVRSYTGEPATEEELAVVLEAGKAAPVAMGKFDQVHMTVVTNKELLGAIDKAGAQMFGNPDLHPLYGAPTLIVVSAVINGVDNPMYSSAAMVVHNMALAAMDLGLGACDIWGAIRAVVASDELTAALQLPEGFTPCCALALGKTDEELALREIPEDKIAVTTLA